MALNLHHLRIFVAIVEHGTLSEAGEALGITQPAVSRQATALEEALGERLFDRGPREIRLTEAGALLARYGRRLFTVEAEAEHALGELRRLERGRLRLGASLTIANHLLPPLLAEFADNHPELELSVQIANTETTQSRLREGEIELALTEGVVDDPLFTRRVFARDRLVLVLPPDHALAGQRRVSRTRALKEAMILREPGSGTRAMVERGFGGGPLEPKMVLGSAEAIKAVVARGLGVSVLSEWTVAPEVRRGELVAVELTGDRWSRDLHVVRLVDRTPSRAESAFLERLEGVERLAGVERLEDARPTLEPRA